jgi:hypothetical protein
MMPDVLFAGGGAPLVALQKATQTIPIVFVGVADSVANGFVASVARPGGNVTGFATYEQTIAAVWSRPIASFAARPLSGCFRTGHSHPRFYSRPSIGLERVGPESRQPQLFHYGRRLHTIPGEPTQPSRDQLGSKAIRLVYGWTHVSRDIASLK